MRHPDWLLRQLPVAMTEDDDLDDPMVAPFFIRFLRIFQSVTDTVLHQIDNLPHVFDPSIAPPSMVREMGRWIGIDWLDPEHQPALQRHLVRSYSTLLRTRGTREGLIGLLELIGGKGSVRVSDNGGVHRLDTAPRVSPHVKVEMTQTTWDEDDVVRIVRDEIPAMATFELWIASRLVWPKPEREPGAGRVLEEVH